MNRAGGLFNIGCHVANLRVVLEAGRRLAVIKKETKAKIDKKKNDDKAKDVKTAMVFYAKWKVDGKQQDKKHKGPKLSRDAARSVVKVLLPIKAPEEKMKDFTGMGKCVRWLGSLPGLGLENDMEWFTIDERSKAKKLF